MAENLWDHSNVISGETSTDGVYQCSGYRGLRTNLSIGRLTDDTLFYAAVSVKKSEAGDEYWNITIVCENEDGKTEYFETESTQIKAGKWSRIYGEVKIPSGLTVVQFVIGSFYKGEWEATGAVVSTGSPIITGRSVHVHRAPIAIPLDLAPTSITLTVRSV